MIVRFRWSKNETNVSANQVSRVISEKTNSALVPMSSEGQILGEMLVLEITRQEMRATGKIEAIEAVLHKLGIRVTTSLEVTV